MARNYQQRDYKEGSSYQPRHLIAVSDKEVFFLRSVLSQILPGFLKNRQKVSVDIEKDNGRCAMRLIDTLDDLANDIIGATPHGKTTQRSNNIRTRWESIADDSDHDTES